MTLSTTQSPASEGRDRPVIFSAPMVQALIAGTKRQTRRVLKPQPYPFECQGKPYWNASGCVGGRICISDTDLLDLHRYNADDRLWVRETFARVGDNDDDIHACPDMRVPAYYRADAMCPEQSRWRSPIHMPRALSRLTLIVESVKVERLQDISEEDAVAEGCGLSDEQIAENEDLRARQGDWALRTPYGNFLRLWCAVHGGIGAWDANPWVAALTFRVIPRNIDNLGDAP